MSHDTIRKLRDALAGLQKRHLDGSAEAHWAEWDTAAEALAAADAALAVPEPTVRDRLRDAITWALGSNGEFRTQGTMEGRYWWRRELAERAGLEWDGKQWVAQPAPGGREGE